MAETILETLNPDVYKYTDTFTWEEAQRVISKFNPTTYRHTVTIDSPKGGELYIVHSENSKKSDDSFLWRNMGTRKLYPVTNPVIYKTFYNALSYQETPQIKKPISNYSLYLF